MFDRGRGAVAAATGERERTAMGVLVEVGGSVRRAGEDTAYKVVRMRVGVPTLGEGGGWEIKQKRQGTDKKWDDPEGVVVGEVGYLASKPSCGWTKQNDRQRVTSVEKVEEKMTTTE